MDNKPWKYNNTLNKLTEGCWRTIESEEDVERIKKFFAQPVPASSWPVYCDATIEEKHKLNSPFSYLPIGDDELWDELDRLSREKPDADARKLVASYVSSIIRYKDYYDPEQVKYFRKAYKAYREIMNS